MSRVNGQWLDTNTPAPPIATRANNPPLLIQWDSTLDLPHQSIEWTEILQRELSLACTNPWRVPIKVPRT
jgi:hypothetical protein